MKTQTKKSKKYYDTATATMNFISIQPGQVRMSKNYVAIISKEFQICDHPVTKREFDQYLISKSKDIKETELDDCPIVDINWDETQEYISWLNENSEDFKYRLPTEAEWEYACRAGTTTKYSFGDSDSELDSYGWYHVNSKGQLKPVKQLLPNPWNLYDMHGNVSEWVHDYYEDYPKGKIKDPKGPKYGSERVIRGGAWTDGIPKYKKMTNNVIQGLRTYFSRYG